ncbi:hypothetical protein AMTRI_Chr05g70460 [Amborella trichopoda]
MFKNIAEAGRFEGFKVSSNGLVITHLQYADDTLIFCGSYVVELSNVATFLRSCKPALGLKVNFHKNSLVGVGCHEALVNSFAAMVGCRVEGFLVTYLGIPISDSRLARNAWDSTIRRSSSLL